LNQVADHLEDTPQPEELAWNVVAWNFLKTSREKNVKFNPEEWTKNDSPGMYISYTYARVRKAIEGIMGDDSQITEQDVKLLGASSYKEYYLARSQEQMDASPMANFTLDLAKEITLAYHNEKIIGGRPGFQFAMRRAHGVLGLCMNYLGMKQLKEV
jgi:arginyl-tRNA synthetase